MPIGAIVTVTDITVNDQFDDAPFGNAASIIRLPGGGFAVFWSESTANDGSQGCVQGRFFDANGVPTSPQFIVNTSTNGAQGVPDAVLLADGNIMISWFDNGLNPGDTSGAAVRARVIDQTGATVVAEFLVNTTTTLSQNFPTSILLANGNVMIVWQDLSLLGGDASGSSIKGQVVTAAGVKVGGEFLINTETAGNQNIPQLTLLTNGNVVVTWQDTSGTLGDAQGASVKAQILDASGNKIGGEFLVNTSTFDAQNNMEITALDNGNFIITWQDRSLTGGDADFTSIKAQIFSASGVPIGGEFLVNTSVAYGQTDPAIVELSNGQFVIAWRDPGPPGTVPIQTIRAQVFNADGSRHGTEIIASTVGDNLIVGAPAIEDLGDGRFVITANRTELQGTTQVPRGLFANIFTVLSQVSGTPDADNLTGSAGADAIDGLGGNDVITALGGDDLIDAGDGDDQVLGGDGNDIIIGGSGIDTINGGAGDDQIHCGLGNDLIDGGSGNNEIFGDEGDDQITMLSGSGSVRGGAGNDTITGWGFLQGDEGDDILIAGGTGGSFMAGGEGNDHLTQLNGALGGVLNGDQGNDVIRIEEARGSIVTGGDGDDDITVLSAPAAQNSIDAGSGN
ncbi:MAG: calcium-binding protein, partial [Novosphingobium sp.]